MQLDILSLRLKNGYPQDDAIYERGSHHHFKLSHYRTRPIVLLKGTEPKQALSQIGYHPAQKIKPW